METHKAPAVHHTVATLSAKILPVKKRTKSSSEVTYLQKTGSSSPLDLHNVRPNVIEAASGTLAAQDLQDGAAEDTSVTKVRKRRKKSQSVSYSQDNGLKSAVEGAELQAVDGDEHRSDTDELVESSHQSGRCAGEKVKPVGQCKVCGDSASGTYFGALVCVPCKTLFLRYAGDNTFSCKHNRCCEVTVISRTNCKFCRMQKCITVGMCRKERPTQVQISEGQQQCVVCQDLANGIHFGAVTCEGCKKFFRRGLSENPSYTCKATQVCVINPRTRNACRYCRYQKCLAVGMSRDAIQMGRPSKTKPGDEGEERKRVRLDSGGDNSSASNASSPPLTAGVHSRPPTASVSAPSGFNEDQSTYPPRADIGSFGSLPFNEANSDVQGNMGGYQPNARVSPSTSVAARSVSRSSGFGYEVPGVNTFGSLSDAAVLGLAQHDLTEASPDAIYNLDNSSVSMVWAGSSRERHTSQSVAPALSHDHPIGTYSGQSHESYNQETATPIHATNGKTFDQSASDFTLCSTHSLHLLECSPLSVAPSCVLSAPGDSLTMNGAFGDASLSGLTLPQHYSSGTQQAATAWNVSIDEVLCTLKHEVDDDECDEGLLHEPHELSPASVSTASLSQSMANIPLTTSLSTAVTNHVISSMTLSSYGASADSSDVVSRTLGCSQLSAKEQLVDMNYRADYWTNASLPHEDILLSDAHVQIVYDIQAAYNRFVETSSNINKQLRTEFENLRCMGLAESEMMEKLHARIHFLYTVTSVTYCQNLPGFKQFHINDQILLIRMGQSQSRMLVAAIHWYKPADGDFEDFLFWRDSSYGFKRRLLDFAHEFFMLSLEPVEAALLNTLVLAATDYGGLENPEAIENYRSIILRAFRAVTTAMYGSRNSRIEKLFSYMPRLRQLGREHHLSTYNISLASLPPAPPDSFPKSQ